VFFAAAARVSVSMRAFCRPPHACLRPVSFTTLVGADMEEKI